MATSHGETPPSEKAGATEVGRESTTDLERTDTNPAVSDTAENVATLVEQEFVDNDGLPPRISRNFTLLFLYHKRKMVLLAVGRFRR